jgi:two-component system, OmpR family, phosphate regulon sensor histidine kinase PhoR
VTEWQQSDDEIHPLIRLHRRGRFGIVCQEVKLTLQWKWFLGLAALLTTLLILVIVGIDVSLPPYLVGKIQQDLEREARLARQAFAAKLSVSPPDVGEINQLAHQLGRQTGLRLTIISPEGVVIGESDKAPSGLGEIENHLSRPEVQDAVQRGVGTARRHSHTIGVDLLYVAVPEYSTAKPPQLVAIVRVALPLNEIGRTTNRVRRTVAVVGIIVGLIDIPFLFWLARRYSEPIDVMRQMATRVSAGDFLARAPENIGGELGELGSALNQMSDQLETRLRELTAEKAELNATLANMIEGVLVVDTTGHVRLANATVRRQFNLPESVIGKTVMEAFRSGPLQDLIDQALENDQVSARELSFYGEEERVFDVNGACLLGHESTRTGVVVVFHDITRIKELENIRKEFVANVSHELRTPLSIIKGYVETLLDEQPPDALTGKQFLQTIEKHSLRLEALIEDLLSISELESQQARLDLKPVSLRATAHAVAEELKKRAHEKSTSIVVEVPETLPVVRADSQRLHQVFFNLLENAIKYTQAGGRVTVSAEEKDGDIEVRIVDNGMGIAPEHLPRIFERFYRADKARSRELGGTGLGLSIVKHLVESLGGAVSVSSEPGRGSRFVVRLPLSRREVARPA